jgi:ELWxxDGT repeat protein
MPYQPLGKLRRQRGSDVRIRRLMCEALEARTMMTATPQFVADLNSVPEPNNKTGLGLTDLVGSVRIGDLTYFVATDGIHGQELWKSDGTGSGTSMVKDILPGSDGSAPRHLTLVGDNLFFIATGVTGRLQLWKSDGTPEGTRFLKEFSTSDSTSIQNLIGADGTLYFAASFLDFRSALWKSDGTPEGTIQLNTSIAGMESWEATANGLLFADYTAKLWWTDGTPEGTFVVKDFDPNVPDQCCPLTGISGFASIEQTVYFTLTTWPTSALWKTDGTTAGTVLVKDQFTGASGTLTELNGQLLFTAKNEQGAGLFESDGTFEGTDFVAPVFPSLNGFLQNMYVRWNGKLFFAATDAAHGTEFWTTDGTPEGTHLVKDFFSGPASSYPVITSSADGIFIRADDGAHGEELWRSDGTTAGTIRISDINPGPASSYATFFSGLVMADDGIHGIELWKLVDINAAPSFRIGPDVHVTDLSGPQAIRGWATALSAGPPDESRQNLHFEITTSSPNLFLVQPQLDATGKLTFEPQADVTGSAEVSVSLVDDGGTTNGGVDRSAPLTFTIDVAPDKPWHNRHMAPDVSGDGQIVAEDVIDVINYINARGSGPIFSRATTIRQSLAQSEAPNATLYYDVTGDDCIAADDVINIINYINAHPDQPEPQGESIPQYVEPPTLSSSDDQSNDSLLLLIANDPARAAKRRN